MRASIFACASLLLVASCRPAPDAIDERQFAAGKELFEFTCQQCHHVAGQQSPVGPNLQGIVGRRAGNIEDYGYSAAIRDSGIVWTEESLDAFLADPLAFAPGTRMGIAGIESEEQRAAIIYFLKHANARR